MEHKKFGAFIMTYERPETLMRSISVLLEQLFPPEFILIIDNSATSATAMAIENNYKNNDKIGYYKVGYNSGPAGAAKIGLEQLTNLGYQWIYWGDDDNPPRDSTVFQQMFQRIEILENKGINLGIIGGKGGRINKFTGTISALKNVELKNKEVAEVDYVPGGQTMIVNSTIMKSGLLPEEKLFFSFEDLDFCLKVKNKGFKIYVDAKTWLYVREIHQDKGANYRFKGSSFGKKGKLLRDYYSTRSLLYILNKNKLYSAFLFQLTKTTLKMFLGFKYGFGYGFQNYKFQKKALQDFFKNNYTFRDALNKS